MRKKPLRRKEEPSPDEKALLLLRKSFPPIRKKLLVWYNSNSRNYPWRKTGNWFHLLMAEMMLRRTRADQVLPVYQDFARKYKTPKQAAELSEMELEKLLGPLGLSWRGRQMHSTIAYLKDTFSKRKPEAGDNLKEIPGVGDYSEAILRNKLFDEKCAAIDSNVVRFFSRLSGIVFRSENRRSIHFIRCAGIFMNSRRSFDLNLAILDFTALVCKAGNPLCTDCCLRKYCRTDFLYLHDGKKNRDIIRH